MSTAQERHDEVMKEIGGLKGDFLTIKNALVGTEKTVGYFERVRNLERAESGRKKTYLIVGGAILADIGTRLWQALTG